MYFLLSRYRGHVYHPFVPGAIGFRGHREGAREGRGQGFHGFPSFFHGIVGTCLKHVFVKEKEKVCGLWTCACGANPGILIHAHKTYHVCAHIEEIQGIIISLDFWACNLECGIMTPEKAQKCLLFSWCARPGRLQWGSNKPASEGQISIKGRWFQPRFASFCS